MNRTEDEVYAFVLDLKQKLNVALKRFDVRIEEVKKQTSQEVVYEILTGAQLNKGDR